MNTIQSKAIVLNRTDFGEADRIITFLTIDHGKITLMARGVRRVKSKLAGGIELFSTTDVSYIHGKGQIGTLVSARLIRYYDSIVQNIDRVQLGYELIKLVHRATEDQPEREYYDLMTESFESLDDSSISVDLIRIWFQAQLLRFAGHTPNLKTDTQGTKLEEKNSYIFDFDHVGFQKVDDGSFKSSQIKFLRLLFNGNSPAILRHIHGLDSIVSECTPIVQTMLQTYIRI